MTSMKQSTLVVARCCRRVVQLRLDALAVVTKCIYST